MHNFFFFFSTRDAYLRSRIYGDSSHVFLRTKGLGSWLTFSEDLEFLDLGSFFSKDQGFFGLWMFSEDLGFLDLGSCF